MKKLSRLILACLLLNCLVMTVFADIIPNGCAATVTYIGSDPDVIDTWGTQLRVTSATPTDCIYAYGVQTEARQSTFSEGEEYWQCWDYYGGCP